ncbi:major facilitator superfamily-like protein [Fragilaria crotonensis]|nr:major facilitator superfamily-like protein [Fragilaria crotonensis]
MSKQPRKPLLATVAPSIEGHDGKSPKHAIVPVKITRATYIFVLCAAVNSCNLGYDAGANTNAGPKIRQDFNLSDIQLEIYLGSMSFWSMFGASMAQYISDSYGRRRTFIMAALGFILGVAIMSMAPSYEILLCGRFFVGMGIGIGLAIDPLYIAEVSPATRRGELVCWSEIALNVGIVLGFASGIVLYPLSNNQEWRVMLALGAILPIVMIVLVLKVMPESPRWLIANNRFEEARSILERIYPHGFDIDAVVCEITNALELERAAGKSVGWSVILRSSPSVRRMLLVGVGTSVIQQAVGIDAIQYYMIDVLEHSGIKSDKGQLRVMILLGLVKLGFVLVGGKLFDRYGRRPLFAVSLLGCAASLVFVSVTFSDHTKTGQILTVLGLASYLAFFSCGMGPGGWLIPSEVFAMCIRAKAMSVTTFLNRLTATVVATTFLSVAHTISWPGFFLLLAVICVAGALFLCNFLPETMGRSLEDISLILRMLLVIVLFWKWKRNCRRSDVSPERRPGSRDPMEASGPKVCR